MRPQKLRAATALQTYIRAGIRCPEGPDGSSQCHHGMRNCCSSTMWVLWSHRAPGSCRGRHGGLEHLCDFSTWWRISYASKSLLFWINNFIHIPPGELLTKGVPYLQEKITFDAVLKPCIKNQTCSCVISGASGLVLRNIFGWLVGSLVCFKKRTFKTN